MSPSEKPGRGAILRTIQRLYEHGFFIPKNHFERRLEQRDIPHSVLPTVISGAHVARDPVWNEDYANWEVTIEGKTPDDEAVRLGLAVDIEDEILFLLTAYYVD